MHSLVQNLGKIIGLLSTLYFIFLSDLITNYIYAPLIFVYAGYEFDKKFWNAKLLQFSQLNRVKRLTFITTFFNTYGYMSMADGHSSAVEHNVMLNLIQVLQLSKTDSDIALSSYSTGQNKYFQLSRRLNEFKKDFRFNKDLREHFIRLLLDGMISSDDNSTEIVNSLFAISSQVNVSARTLKSFNEEVDIEGLKKFYRKPPIDVGTKDKKKKDKVKDKFDQDMQGNWYNVNSILNKAYKALGVSPSDNNTDIKRAYRILMNKYHPDKVLHKASSESEREFAKNQTIKILKAYELIKKERDFN